MSIQSILFGGYIVGVVVCFGPAAVETNKAIQERYLQCRAEAKRPEYCQPFGEELSLLKAMAWPLWLSYQVAQAV